MTAPIPSCEPALFVAGDSVFWTTSPGNYPATDGWVLKYRLIGTGIDSTVTADTTTCPGSFYTLIPAVTTASVVGELVMRLIGWVTLSAEQHTIYDRVVTVFPNARTASADELQSHSVRMLAAIEAVLEGRATSDIESYAIGGRSVTKMAVADLMRFRGIYAARVGREQHPGALGPTYQTRYLAAR